MERNAGCNAVVVFVHVLRIFSTASGRALPARSPDHFLMLAVLTLVDPGTWLKPGVRGRKTKGCSYLKRRGRRRFTLAPRP
jgi:hypothetical protein